MQIRRRRRCMIGGGTIRRSRRVFLRSTERVRKRAGKSKNPAVRARFCALILWRSTVATRSLVGEESNALGRGSGAFFVYQPQRVRQNTVMSLTVVGCIVLHQ